MRYDLTGIPDLLRKIETENKLTNYQLAERIGRVPRTIVEWKYSRTIPSALDIAVLCEEFDLDINDFFREVR